MWDNEAVEPMDTSETPLSWYYMADCGRWHRFEDDPDNPLRSEDIEQYFGRNSKGVLHKSSSNCHIKIDFSAMLWTDYITGGQKSIQRGYNIGRSCSCFSAPPVLWERVDPTCPYQLIPLSELRAEYQTVAHYVKTEGLLGNSIVSISRIQNMDLWDMYCLKKKQLMRIQGVKEIQEKRLFHGTKLPNVDSICKYNFDLRLSEQGCYGQGIYFAKHATYADRYSLSSTDPLPFYGGGAQGRQGQNTKVIFLARVMIGKSTAGQMYFRKPDHGSIENSHDSCVDDVTNPKIFVIFDPNQIYPEYLIQYN
ncbi:protein mono-ADP-ribosyltransferase PARP11-like [Anoplopoma fimbria]|uniref:protein mono-ADP-ribosyltransferase PARP11-like n=1 Tax=Anoplopoma fimbria TaxID=229290 RepID=UPI0023ECEA45|nr:protein mono-ADP-ribosyltransferase PARP11-like [Anoplopoma fimbria]